MFGAWSFGRTQRRPPGGRAAQGLIGSVGVRREGTMGLLCGQKGIVVSRVGKEATEWRVRF